MIAEISVYNGKPFLGVVFYNDVIFEMGSSADYVIADYVIVEYHPQNGFPPPPSTP